MAELVNERVQSEELRECLRDYLENTGAGPLQLTFNELMYFKEFLSELRHVLAGGRDTDAALSDKLVYLNFNHLAFFNYYQHKIKEELENADTPRDQLDILGKSLVVLQSMQLKPAFRYHSSWPGIKNMLEDWLKAETERIQNLEKHGSMLQTTTHQEQKLAFNQSVAQIACLLRALYEEHCFAGLSVTDLLKFSVTHFRSKRQEHISHGSLSKEYYGISQVTAAAVLDLLQRMINRIKKQYFPAWAAVCTIAYSILSN